MLSNYIFSKFILLQLTGSYYCLVTGYDLQASFTALLRPSVHFINEGSKGKLFQPYRYSHMHVLLQTSVHKNECKINPLYNFESP